MDKNTQQDSYFTDLLNNNDAFIESTTLISKQILSQVEVIEI